jgi:hypothetical protein
MNDPLGGTCSVQLHRRARVRLPVRISTIDPEIHPETGRPYFCSSEEVSLDVSRGGIFVTTEEPLSPGRRLLIELDLPGGSSVQTLGRVAWSRIRVPGETSEWRVGIGVEFMGGSTQDLFELARFVDRTGPRSRSGEAEGRAPGANPAVPGA